MPPDRQRHHSGNMARTIRTVARLCERINIFGDMPNRQASTVEIRISTPMIWLNRLACSIFISPVNDGVSDDGLARRPLY